MSFEMNLWNSVPQIHNHFNNKLSGYKDLLDGIYEHSRAELDKSARLKKINFLNNYLLKEENTLADFIKNMNKFYTKLCDNYKNFALKIQVQIEQQKKLIEDFKKKAKTYHSSLEAVEKDYFSSLNKLKNLKDEYHEIGRLTERSFYDKFRAESNVNLTIYDKEDSRIRADKMRHDFCIAEKNYQNFLSSVNKKRVEYIAKKELYLKDMQEFESVLNKCIKETLLKLNIDMEECYQDILWENKNLKTKLIDFNEDADLFNFINKNKSDFTPPPYNEFSYYNIICRINPPKDADVRIIHKTIVAMQNSLTYKDENNLYDEEEEEKRVLIAELSSKVWHNSERFDNQDFQEIKKLFKDKKHRLYFLEYLNKHRGSGAHILSAECFKKIGLILNLLLDEVYESKDFITAKYCLILSQTYNKQEGNTNTKISLQDTIEKNELLRNLYFWEEYISFILLEEIESSNLKQGDLSKETEEDKNNRLGNIFFSQLIHICYNMISFKIPKKDIKDIILTYSKQNNLPDHYEEQLLIMIDTSEYVDYVELAKKEKERIEFEHEYNQIASEKNYKGSFQENLEKRRSKSEYVDNIGNQNPDLDQENSSKNFKEIDYEFIDKNDVVGNELRKIRSQSFYESSNTDKILMKRNSESNWSRKSSTIPEHYLNNDINKIAERELQKTSCDYMKHKSSEDEIKMINDFYTSPDLKSSEKLTKEIKQINIQAEEEINGNADQKIYNCDINPETIQLTSEDFDAELVVRKNSEEKMNKENQD